LALVGLFAAVLGALSGSILFGLVAWEVLPILHDPIIMGLNGKQLVEMAGGVRMVLLMGLREGGLFGLRLGMILGLFGGMISGGAFAIRHFVTRLSIWLDRESPLAYRSFLDYAVDRLFLFKLAGGGGYLFAHETLSKYFISIHKAQT